MKVLLLSDTYSEHTEKWAVGLSQNGVEVGVFSFNRASYPWYEREGITVFFEPEERINAESFLTKLSYVKYVTVLNKIIKHFKPDILHAHYATSYGFIGAITGFHPFALSVWGTDVFDFPKRSRFHTRIFQYNLKKADAIFSTSEIMRDEVKRYTGKEVIVTPFGVDTSKFSPPTVHAKNENCIHVGTIKPIEDIYGIIQIIDAAEILTKKYPSLLFKFWLIGPGDTDRYRKIIEEKGMNSIFELTGRIPFDQIHDYHKKLDIFLNVSIVDESFGVAAVEAMACERPVIVTDAPGLKEVTGNGECGIIIPKGDAESLAQNIKKLADDRSLREELGKKGKKRVMEKYDWNNNLELMIVEYKKLMK